MNTANTQLNDEQLHDLVAYITEDYGTDIDQDTFAMALLTMMEDVAGMECLTDYEQENVVAAAFKLYTQINQTEK